jgi:predicted nucleotidyltransferase component of viral defense system
MNNIIEAKLKEYAPKDIREEEHALKEILQEVALYGLANTNFFDEAAFHGGSALRILHALPRFSEDLDFLLKSPNPNFNWELYMDAIINTCKQYGIHPEVIDKSRVDSAVKKMFLKDDSIGKIINLDFVHHSGRKLAIKFEIDTNPPAGSEFSLNFLNFPLDCSVISQNLSSSFAGKCHALLCRQYIKGRDWYDFSWYISRKTVPNFIFLKHALYQQGPWANQDIQVNSEWFIEAMKQKIESIDWAKAVSDVALFVNTRDRQSLNIWGVDLFMDRLNKLAAYLSPTI